jgi:probable rRNA maturation factor
MKIQIENKQDRIRIDRRKIRSTVTKLLRYLNCSDKEVSLSFVNDEFIQILNKKYLKKNKPTNVLSFSLQEGEFNYINLQILGDIVISVDTAQRDALKGDLPLQQEIDFLIIHGLLHLLGYKHEHATKKEIKMMKAKEEELSELLDYYNLD